MIFGLKNVIVSVVFYIQDTVFTDCGTAKLEFKVQQVCIFFLLTELVTYRDFVYYRTLKYDLTS